MRKRALSVGAEEEIRTYLDSRPPPADLESHRFRVEARLESDSAIHDLRDWQRAQRAADIAAIASRFDLEKERRLSAEGELKSVRERWWSIVTGVVVLVLAAAILWIAATLTSHR